MDIKVLLQAIPFEIERSFCKHINKILKRRPSSKPFLSGDTFREFADVLYDETYKCAASDIKEGSVVFVKTDFLDEFISEIVSRIDVRFILVTHQSDINILNSKKYIEIANNSNIKHWFAQNCILEHEKVSPLPIGLENAHNFNAGYLKDFKKLSKNVNQNKKPEVVVAFTLGTNPDDRFECYRTLWHKDICIEYPSYLNCRQYRKRLQKSMFVASPAGNGLDCHRMWEAIYLGVVPILKKDTMTAYFQSLNLPIWIIDDWSELDTCTKQELANKYFSIVESSSPDAAFIKYWETQITKYKLGRGFNEN